MCRLQMEFSNGNGPPFVDAFLRHWPRSMVVSIQQENMRSECAWNAWYSHFYPQHTHWADDRQQEAELLLHFSSQAIVRAFMWLYRAAGKAPFALVVEPHMPLAGLGNHQDFCTLTVFDELSSPCGETWGGVGERSQSVRRHIYVSLASGSSFQDPFGTLRTVRPTIMQPRVASDTVAPGLCCNMRRASRSQQPLEKFLGEDDDGGGDR